MRRRLLVLVTVIAGLAVGACAPVKPGVPVNELAKCEAAAASVIAHLGTRALAPVVCSGGSGLGGVYDRSPNIAYVFYDANPAPISQYEDVAAHELGHAWDALSRMTLDARRRYQEIRGVDPRPNVHWDAEDFAAVFALLLGYQQAGVAPPTPQQRAALCTERIVPC